MIGKALISAEKDLKNKIWRIVRIDDIPLHITLDFKQERLNLEINNNLITNIWNG